MSPVRRSSRRLAHAGHRRRTTRANRRTLSSELAACRGSLPTRASHPESVLADRSLSHLYGALTVGLLFDEIVQPIRAEHQFVVAAALYGWLAEDDAEEAEIRFLVVEDLWLLLDPEQRLALTCDA